MISSRRSFITGLASLVVAPAIVRASSLMPVKPVALQGVAIAELQYTLLSPDQIAKEAIKLWRDTDDFYRGQQWTPVELSVLSTRIPIAVNRLLTLERTLS